MSSLPSVAASGGLARYLEEIRRFPMLEPQQEYMLAKRWQEHEDAAAAQKLVTSHLRLVARIAMGYRGYGLPIGEVISEGNVGLMQAVKRFDPDKGFRLATYAMWWIRAAIQEYILRSWSLVKMGTTASQKKLFFNLRKAKSQLQALEEGDLRPDQVALIATNLGVPEEDVISMNRRLGGDASLNAPLRADSESGEWQDWLVDDSPSQETTLVESEELDRRREYLEAAMESLNERERRIFTARRLADEPMTLEELSSEFNVSRERIRQIEVRAFEKVQKAVQKAALRAETPRAAAAAAASAPVLSVAARYPPLTQPTPNSLPKEPPRREGQGEGVLRGGEGFQGITASNNGKSRAFTRCFSSSTVLALCETIGISLLREGAGRAPHDFVPYRRHYRRRRKRPLDRHPAVEVERAGRPADFPH